MRTLARLQDVERQLCTAATAVQLHLRGLGGEREHIGWAEIAALAIVCGRIEQVQNELSQSTVEILALARKSVAGGGSTDTGEETETEDENEDVELEDAQRLKDEPSQAEEAEAQVEHIGEQDGASKMEEEMQDQVIIKVEQGTMAENLELSGLNEEGQLCDAAVETEKAELNVEEISRRNENEILDAGVEITETGCTLDGLENVEESKQSETTEVKHELTMEAEGGAVEVARYSRVVPNEAKCEEKQVEIEVRTADVIDSELLAAAEPNTTTEPESVKEIPVELLENMIFMVQNTKTIGTTTVVSEANTSSVEADDHGNPVNGLLEIENKRTSVAVIPGEYEDTQQATVTIVKPVQGKELITQKTEFSDGETSESPEANVREKELEQHVKAARHRAADAINNFQRSLKSGNCTVDAAVNFTGIVRDTASVVTSHDSKYSRRIWIEKVVVICNSILQDVQETELAQALSPLTESCSHLQRYISSHFPDYLQDILNGIDTLQNSGGLNARQLAFWLPRLLKQLRKDCGVYYKKIKGNSGELRSDEKWDKLTLICERLTKWIKQLSPGDTNKLGNDQQQTVETLTAFNEYFPNRIPTELLEAMRRAAELFDVSIT
ncbi:hypothetical protein PR003_g5208 [Phytophthora rubi]|nr:hypothetical protein PR002_g8991 [Phytophthora rubi]KAE9350779.1 hypothetical protein PR003_g5208 [Phytophthora rubi]